MQVSRVPPTTATPVFSYSGGKRQLSGRIVNMFREYFPSERHLVAPFLGGGAVELRFMVGRDGTCHGADADPHLIMFWQNLIEDAGAVANHARSLMVEPMDRARWQSWYADMMAGAWHSAEHAAKYFILRYTRVVHAWNIWERRANDFNKPTVHLEAFARLSHFRAPRLTVECSDFRTFLDTQDTLSYLDPPYYSSDRSMERVYEKRNADDDNVFTQQAHEDLADILSARDAWILSYSDHPWVRQRYQDYRILEVQVTYMSRSAQQRDKRADELIIVSK